MFGASSLQQQKHSSGKAKEPAVASAEKFMLALQEGSLNEVSQTLLDPKILFNCPMGIFFSRPHVKRWIAFELSVIGSNPIQYHGTVSEDGMRMAKNFWSVGGLHFMDTINLNQVLMIKSVKRTMVRKPANAKEAKLTDELLLAWTGPYFSRYCGPKAGKINNRALVLPVLDYAYQDISNCRELLNIRPRDGKEIKDFRIALHFLTDASVEEVVEAAGSDEKPSIASQLHHSGPKKDEVVIKARNKDGEQAALVVDRATLGATEDGGRIESLEDQEVVTKEDRLRFVASGLKLCNNKLKRADDLDQAIKIFVVNAFYFLNWVDLSSNLLESIPDLSQLPIIVFYLHDNKLQDLKEVEKLRGLSQLQTLTLFGNPIQSNATKAKDYKFSVLNALWEGHKERYTSTKTTPKISDMPLRTFDHSVITSEDRSCLERYSAIHAKGSRSRPQSRQ